MANATIAAKGTLIIIRDNGSHMKTGIRIRDGIISVFDTRVSQWLDLPVRIPVRGGGTAVLTVGYE